MVGSDGEARVSCFSRVFFVAKIKFVGRVQIQIILYLLKLSLPGPAPPPPAPLESPKKRKRSVRPQPAVPVLTLEDHLEVFMNKLSMWQLVATLDLSGKLRDTKDERDWMQIFCEDIIEPQYVTCPSANYTKLILGLKSGTRRSCQTNVPPSDPKSSRSPYQTALLPPPLNDPPPLKRLTLPKNYPAPYLLPDSIPQHFPRPPAAVTQRSHERLHLFALVHCPYLSSRNEERKNVRGVWESIRNAC